MADPNAYSRFVNGAKIVLPIIALALLSTLFLLARVPEGDPQIPYATLEAMARKQSISNPQMTGVATDGTQFVAGAQVVTPAGAQTTAERIAIGMQTASGAETKITAETGSFDADAKTVRLDGLSRITTSTGFVMETAGATADLTSGRVETDGALEVRAPFGQLTAGQMVVDTPDGAGQTLIFQNGVRLLYTPQTQE